MTQPTSSHDPKGKSKLARIPIKIEKTERLPKPNWLRVQLSSDKTHHERIKQVKNILKEQALVTVCEEASCPNLPECFGHGTATFMIMGDKCTRRCTFCDVAHGKPDPLDPNEPQRLATTIKAMDLRYVVITSVDRDDLRDGGAGHFVDCITTIRTLSPDTKIEVLVPDFRGGQRMEKAIGIFEQGLPDVFNHNIETVPRLYRQVRPGSDYQCSLNLLKRFHEQYPSIPTKSGIMVGLGETNDEIENVLRDLKAHDVSMITIGQYLQPSHYHTPVDRYVHPDAFETFRQFGETLGFTNVASGPLVRSSYHADQQAKGEKVA